MEGEMESAELSLEEANKILTDNKELIQDKDRDFITSLMLQYKTSTLSSKQAYWFKRLANQVLIASAEKDDAVEVPNLGDLGKVFDWFDNAMGKIKFPMITFELLDGTPLIMKKTRKGKHPGCIAMAASNGQHYGDFFGWLRPNGEWIKPYSLKVEESLIEILIEELAEDPEGYVVNHGHKSGKCCFCNSKLESENSTKVGYGPHCAKVWGLPWTKTEQKAFGAK